MLKKPWCAVLTVAIVYFSGCSEQPAWEGEGSEAELSTIRDGSAYRVYVNGVERAYIPLREVSNTIVTALTRDGSRAAIIADHDTSRGENLTVLDVASGELSTLFRGPVSSARFSRDGTRLAYAVEIEGGASVKIGTATSVGETLGELGGRQVELLGFSADDRSLFAVVYPDRQDDGTFSPSLVRMSTRDGQAVTILDGNPLVSRQRYSDIRLVRVDGQDRLSYIVSGHQICVGTSELQLASTDGQVTQSFGFAADAVYRSAVWSADGSQVAYAVQPCPDKARIAGDREAETARQAQGTGVFVAPTDRGPPTRVIDGIPGANLLAVADNGVLRLGTDRDGIASLDSKLIAAGARSVVKAEHLLPSSKQPSAVGPVTRARTNMARHVNQLYDTRDAFDGHGSCGPTTAVMTMAAYQLPEWGMNVSYGGFHYTGWGRYVTDSYTYNGTTFNRTQPDFSGLGAWSGAHGWIYLPCCGAAWGNMFDYMNRHTGWTRQNGWDASWVRSELNRGQLVAVTGYMTSAGHIALIKGWTDDGRWVVNDPFGVNTSGGPGGADQIYTTAYLRAVQVWSN